MLLFIHAVFVFQSKSRHFAQGSQTMDYFSTSIVTFETDVANFENFLKSAHAEIDYFYWARIHDLVSLINYGRILRMLFVV